MSSSSPSSDQPLDLLDMARPFLTKFMSHMRSLPLFTLVISAAMTLFYLLSFVTRLLDAFALSPSNIPNFELSRLTTYPLIHSSFLQFLLSVAAFVPLLARFEQQYGTLRTLAMFLGPFESVPGLLYCFVNGVIFRRNTPVFGAYGFVFVLLTIEIMIYARGEDRVVIAGLAIPTVAGPLLLILPTLLLVPGSSMTLLLGSILVGVIFSSGRVDFLLLPLKIVNFVEEKGHMVVRKVPGYITAHDAEMNGHSVLPTTESRSDVTDSSDPVVPVGSLAVPGGSRPAYNRQVSSTKFMPSGQRED